MSTVYSLFRTMITVMACFVCSTAMRLLPPPPTPVKSMGISKTIVPTATMATPILKSEYMLEQERREKTKSDRGPMSAIRDSSRWIASVQDAAYLRPTEKKGLVPISVNSDKISFLGGNDLECTLLEGLDRNAKVDLDTAGGAFISFKFPTPLPQHDAIIGRISNNAKLLAHSRIKRWWMAPTFLNNVDDIPVETQLILLEIPLTAPDTDINNLLNNKKKSDNNNIKGKSPVSLADEEDATEMRLKLFSDKSFVQKKYAVIAPLIDFDRGFRTTFFGGKEGGLPAGKGVLAARIESGDPDVCTSQVDNAVYVAVGNDPYELLEIAYESISKKMGTFRTRKQKLRPPGIDTFGFCTWDAFYSSVDSDKVSAGLDSLADAGVTVKYVILDDGWQSTAVSGKNRKESEKAEKEVEKEVEVQRLSVEANTKMLSAATDQSTRSNLESSPSSALLQSDLLLLDGQGVLNNLPIRTPPSTSSSFQSEIGTGSALAVRDTIGSSAVGVVGGGVAGVGEKEMEGEDGELSGAQIDGNLAAQKMLEKESSPVVALLTQAVSGFYTKYVEQGAPDSWPVKLWAALSQNTILKEKLIDFFDSQTDFSKRLTSWKANSKFENPSKGKTLKGFVRNLKERKGIDYVFVWHALSGYWGGVSTDIRDDMTSALSRPIELRRPSLLNAITPYLPSNEGEVRINLNIAAGAIVGGSKWKLDEKSSTEIAIEQVKKVPNTWFLKIRKLRSALVSVIRRPETITETLQEGLFKGGLLQLSQRILALTNTSDSGEAVKRSYSRPTPHLLLVEPALAWDPSALVGVGSVAVNKLEEMYHRMHTYLAEAGIDGVKVDAQSGIGAFGVGNGGGSTIAQACVRAVENSAKSAFSSQRAVTVKDALFNLQLQQKVGTLGSIVRKARGVLGLSTLKRAQEVDQGGLLDSPLALTGCMCHSTENLLNYYETSMARASDDFYPKDMAAQTVHLVSCAYNTVMLGEIATTDWDMFHSKHPFAGMHAAARAISGGPVYVSDSPGNHDSELLSRLVLPDGGILRAQIPARPTVDCLFSDVQKDGTSAMKLWSMNKVGAVAGIFNVQGSSWDRKQRRYVQYIPSMMLPVLSTELRARDIGGPFSALLGSDSKQTQRGRERGDEERGEKGDKGMLEMFATWSSREKKLSILRSRNDMIRFEVQPKGWDVVSMSRILLVSGTGENVQRRRPLLKIRNVIGRLRGMRNTDPSSTDSDTSDNINNNNNNNNNNVDGSNAIYWSPIGLLDMLNTGGAVEQILPSKAGRSAVFLAKGPGRFGVFSTHSPKKVTVDGEDVEFNYEILSAERERQTIILGDESEGNVGLNINAEVIMKEVMHKVEEMSDEVQSFINDASTDYKRLLFSEKKGDNKGSKKQQQEGLISITLNGDNNSALPLKLNPLSGVQKVAIYW